MNTVTLDTLLSQVDLYILKEDLQGHWIDLQKSPSSFSVLTPPTPEYIAAAEHAYRALERGLLPMRADQGSEVSNEIAEIPDEFAELARAIIEESARCQLEV